MDNFHRKNRFRKTFNRVVYGSFYRADTEAERNRMKRKYKKEEEKRKHWYELQKMKREKRSVSPKVQKVADELSS